jgi:hypothetical protein
VNKNRDAPARSKKTFLFWGMGAMMPTPQAQHNKSFFAPLFFKKAAAS